MKNSQIASIAAIPALAAVFFCARSCHQNPVADRGGSALSGDAEREKSAANRAAGLDILEAHSVPSRGIPASSFVTPGRESSFRFLGLDLALTDHHLLQSEMPDLTIKVASQDGEKREIAFEVFFDSEFAKPGEVLVQMICLDRHRDPSVQKRSLSIRTYTVSLDTLAELLGAKDSEEVDTVFTSQSGDVPFVEIRGRSPFARFAVDRFGHITEWDE